VFVPHRFAYALCCPGSRPGNANTCSVALSRPFATRTPAPSAVLEPSCTSDVAIATYTKILQITPTYAPYYYGRAYHHVEKAACEFDLAIANYTEAIRLKPDYVDAYNGRAYAYSQKHEFGKASKDYQEVVKLRQPPPMEMTPKAEPAAATGVGRHRCRTKT